MLLGALLGSAATYAALERPWAGGEVADTGDAGPVIAEADDKKPDKKKRRKKRGNQVEIQVDGDDIPELSAADRQLIWKGDKVALPKQSIDMGSEGGGRPLSGSEINSVVQGQSDRMLACITSARGNAQLASKIEVEMLVNGDGRVEKSRFRAPKYLFDNGFYGCARKAANAMRFPATGGFTVVEAPYDLY